MLINKCRYHKLAYISNHLHTCTRIATLHIGCCISYPSENGRCYISQEAKKKEYVSTLYSTVTLVIKSLSVCVMPRSRSLFLFSLIRIPHAHFPLGQFASTYSTLIATTSAPNLRNSSIRSENARISLGHTKLL